LFPFVASSGFQPSSSYPRTKRSRFHHRRQEFWVINAAQSLLRSPAQAGIRSNLNLITASGHVYSFLLTEISNQPNAEPDLKLFVEPKKAQVLQ